MFGLSGRDQLKKANPRRTKFSWFAFCAFWCQRAYLEQLKAVALITMRVCVSDYVTKRLVARGRGRGWQGEGGQVLPGKSGKLARGG